MTVRTRLPAAERRALLLDCALRAFARGTYRGTTTAEIARAAGVTEPVLYKHFPSKRDLYIACLEAAWERSQARWAEAMEAEDDPAEWLPAMGRATYGTEEHALVANVWLQALGEASEDTEIRRSLRRRVRAIHRFIADAVRAAQEAGALRRELDPVAEAWLFIATGLLGAVGVRLGGLLDDDVEAIRSARRDWLRLSA